MKNTELMAAVNAGGIFCVGTLLNSRIDKIQIRDKTSGQRRDSFVFRAVVITENDAVTVTRFLRDGENPDTFKVPVKKGEKLVVRVTGAETTRGSLVLNGEIEPLT